MHSSQYESYAKSIDKAEAAQRSGSRLVVPLKCKCTAEDRATWKGLGRNGSCAHDNTLDHNTECDPITARRASKVVKDIWAYQDWKDAGSPAHPVFNKPAWMQERYEKGLALPLAISNYCYKCKCGDSCACRAPKPVLKPSKAEVVSSDAPTVPAAGFSDLNGRADKALVSRDTRSVDQFIHELACSVGVKVGRHAQQ